MMFAGIVLILLGTIIILFGSVTGTVLKTPRGRRLEALLGKVGVRVYYLIKIYFNTLTIIDVN